MSLVGSRPGPIFWARASSATPCGELVEDAVLDEQSGARGAGLTVVEQEATGRAGDRGVEVGVGEDDLRALAAEFQRDLLEVARRGVDDLPADIRRPGERDLVDVAMRRKRRADVAESGEHVDDSVGHAGVGDDLGEQQRGERCLLGGLEDHGIAARERGRHLECRHHQREVPRDDLRAHPDRLAKREGVEPAARRPRHRHRDGAALDLGGPTGVVAGRSPPPT